ncbi:pseudouridine synthase [Xanthomonadaceae bacterium JHOS43]|nr:pseudouridine synthase [Xanthomonadaceae bacterium JHOS43]
MARSGACRINARVKPARPTRHGVARVLSKVGLCSRSEAARRVKEGRVEVNGRCVLDPEFPCDANSDRILVDGQPLRAAPRVCIALNKPRGLVTTVADEKGRETVYRCLVDVGVEWLAPVGRLDKASEGLLLFTNDPAFAARITDPSSGPLKTYHVQVDGIPGAPMLDRMVEGIADDGDVLRAAAVTLLRQGQRNAWLEVVLDEGRNRHIRRLLAALGLEVLRLVRVAIGPVLLGDLAKGTWRALAPHEIAQLQSGSSGHD